MNPAAVLAVVVKAQGISATNAQLTGMHSNLVKTGYAADGLQKKSSKGFDEVAKKSKYVAGAVAVLGGVAVKMAADFEQSMNTLQAVSGASVGQMRDLRKEAIALGADIHLPATSAKDASEAMTEMVKAGVSVKDTMGGVRDVLVLSAAAQVSNARAAQIASNAMNAFHLHGKDVKSITDQLANAANASSVEINDVADSFKMAAAVFSGFQGPAIGSKKALTELTTAIALLGNAGIKGSDAGTSLKEMLLQLTGPSRVSKNAMEALYVVAKGGITTEKELRDAVQGGAKERDNAINAIAKHNKHLEDGGDIAFTAAGKMRSLKDIVALTAAGTKHMTDVERDAYITQIFGADATRAVIALMQAGPGAFDKMTSSVMRQGAAQALADAKMKGLKGSIEALKSAAETLAITFGTTLLPAITATVRAFTSLAAPLGMHRTLALALIGTLGALAGSIWAVTSAAKAYLTIQTLIEAGAIGAVGPFVAVAAAVVALGIGFIYAYKHSEAFRVAVQAVMTWLQGAGTAALVFVQTAFRNTANTITSVTGSVVGEVKQWDVLFGAISGGVTVMVSIVKLQLAVLGAVWRAGMIALMPVAVAIWTGIKGIFSGAWTALKGIVTGGLQALRGVIEIFGGLFKGDFGQMWDGVKHIFTGGITALKGILEGAWKILKAPVDSIAAGLHDAFSNTWDRIKGLFDSGVNAVIKFLNVLISGVNIVLKAVGAGTISPIGGGGGKGKGGGRPDTAGNPNVTGHARGGAFARTGGYVNSPITLMGEEAPRHPEYVIPTNPAYRGRAQGLLAQAAAAVGMAKGGKFSVPEMAQLWTGKGGAAGIADTMGTIGLVESGGDPRAHNPSGASGLWQILGQLVPGDLFNPGVNALNAIAKYHAQGLHAWDASRSKWEPLLGKTFTPNVPNLGDILGKFPSVSSLPKWVQGVGKFVIDKATGFVKDKIGGLFDASSGAFGPGGRVGTTKGPGGVGSFLGVPMANWVIESLKYAQSKGVVVKPTSGYRPGVDPHTASGRSEHQGTAYPHGAVDFGGYNSGGEMKMAVVNATRDFKYPLLAPIGFHDDGHASGTGHKRGGMFKYLGGFARGGVTQSDGMAYLHKNEAVVPMKKGGGPHNLGRGNMLTNVNPGGTRWFQPSWGTPKPHKGAPRPGYTPPATPDAPDPIPDQTLAWIQAAVAQARLTADTADDRAAQRQMQDYLQQQYDSAVAGGDPTAIADAANALADVMSDAIAELTRIEEKRLALDQEIADRQKRLDTMIQTQGPQMIAAVVAAVSGGIGGKVGLGFQSPSYPGGVAAY